MADDDRVYEVKGLHAARLSPDGERALLRLQMDGGVIDLEFSENHLGALLPMIYGCLGQLAINEAAKAPKDRPERTVTFPSDNWEVTFTRSGRLGLTMNLGSAKVTFEAPLSEASVVRGQLQTLEAAVQTSIGPKH